MERIFYPSALLFFLLWALAAFVLGVVVGLAKGDGAKALWRGAEAGVLALFGGFLARSFLSVLLGAAGDSEGARWAVGWFFFLWPGAIDTLSRLIGQGPVFTADTLLWIAAVVGCFAGMMDGLWQIHKWDGAGWIAFPLDMTWGLAGTANGCLFHLINFLWADHADEPRSGAHRYLSGFRFKGGFAVTQGATMSNMGPSGPASDLFRHENTHVWQNRVFGPLFTLTYLGWMGVWALPGGVAGGVTGAGPFQGIEKWSYFNNPWEAWAYAVGCGPRASFGYTSQERRLIWPDLFVILWAIPFFGLVSFLFLLITMGVW